jgi:hypothetical protein
MWFPRPVYEALPYGYALVGAVLLAVAFFGDVGPRGLLLAIGVVALLGGLVLLMRRRDYRANHAEYDRHSIDD